MFLGLNLYKMAMAVGLQAALSFKGVLFSDVRESKVSCRHVLGGLLRERKVIFFLCISH